MLRTDFFIPTLKETPKEAEVVSHELLLRSGMVRQVASGIYAILPLGYRVLKKIFTIVEKEMDNAGALEMIFPIVQPSEPWKESGRWYVYGKEMLRFKDRLGRDFLLGPTHEEICTTIFSNELHSYKQLPVTCYQIHWKFRDEARPRFGLLRGREFLMKDAYSFDDSPENLDISYQKMYDAYIKIFSRLGLHFSIVEADTGSIGGSDSHEFMALADIGEDTIVSCPSCLYAANIERATVAIQSDTKPSSETLSHTSFSTLSTPNVNSIDELSSFLSVEKSQLIKSMAYRADDTIVVVSLLGTKEVSETKLKSFLGATTLERASEEDILTKCNSAVGFLGPIGLPDSVVLIFDTELSFSKEYIVGGNAIDTHFSHVCLGRDVLHEYTSIDVRVATQGDRCIHCDASLSFSKGIEVGHIFKLGTKYSEAMNAQFLTKEGKLSPFVMGCYGIGVSRLISAIIEQNHDEAGITFPFAVAPFSMSLIPLDKNDEIMTITEMLYNTLQEQGYDVLYDNRDERPGIKLKDADLIGIPVQIILGKKSFERGIIEVKIRSTGEKKEIAIDTFIDNFIPFYTELLLNH